MFVLLFTKKHDNSIMGGCVCVRGGAVISSALFAFNKHLQNEEMS